MKVTYIGSKDSPNETKVFGHPVVKGQPCDLPDDVASRLKSNPSFHVGDGEPPVISVPGQVEDVTSAADKEPSPALLEEVAALKEEIDRLNKVNTDLNSQHKAEMNKMREANADNAELFAELEKENEALKKQKPATRPAGKK